MKKDTFNKINEETQDCKKIGNGINLTGYKAAIDLMQQIIDTLYFNFQKGSSEGNVEENQMTFFNSSDLAIVEENMFNSGELEQTTYYNVVEQFKMMRNLHFADAYNIIDDIEKSYSRTNKTTMIFSVISICFSSGLLIIKLTYLNQVVEKVVEIFKKNITQYIR